MAAATDELIRASPKIVLHEHLDGGLRPQTIIDLAPAAGLDLPETDAAALGDWFVDSCSGGDLVDYLSTFDITTAVMQTEEGLARVAREAVLDLAADGAVYAELRWAPEQHVARGLSLDAAVAAVQAGIEQGIAEAEAGGWDIRIGQLVSAMRHLDRSLEIARLAVRHRDRGVVGFDIAGPERGYPASLHRPAFEYLAHELMPVTVHAGEADGLESILSALVDGRALRIGHGVGIALDIREGDDRLYTLGPLARWVLDREIPLEIAPSSNLQTNATGSRELQHHPIDLLLELGFRVTVNSDNRLQSGTSISRELELLVDEFAWDAETLELVQLNAAEAAFQPIELRDEYTSVITTFFSR